MSPTLLGEHFMIRCLDCQFEFAIDAQNPPASKRAVCPNCGYQKNNFTKLKARPGKTVFVDMQNKSLDRWDIVAVSSGQSDIGKVKRVIGLPGETIDIRDGNIFADGQLVQKPIELQRKMRVHVYDSQFLPGGDPDVDAAELPNRLLESFQNNWRVDPESEQLEFLPEEANDEFQRLKYQHWSCLRIGDDLRTEPATIKDSYGYNQNISRDLNETDELFVRLDCSFDSNAVFRVMRIHSRRWGDSTDWVVEPSNGKLVLSQSGQPDQSFSFKPNLELVIELSNFDRKLVFAINGQVICNLDMKGEWSGEISKQPILIGARRGQVTLQRCQIWRDIYYLAPPNMPGNYQVGANHYFLLGDNCPVSKDSRTQQLEGVPREQIIGIIDSTK